MPPYQRRRYYYRNWWGARRRRAWYRRRRPRNAIFRRKRRRRRVRKRFFKRARKLKKLRLNQWQPTSIKKCRIEGYLCLFQAGFGRYTNNYALWKESIFPHNYPGGGGWSIQQLSLGNLYTQHKEQMNYWTKSNDRLNMCRYFGCIITCFRQPYTDYVFSYFENIPKNVSKYFYCSQHPLRQLNYKRKRVIASYNTQPHRKKPYKRIFIPPPKPMKNQWFFQQQLADYPLVTFIATACSLTNMFGSNTWKNNNVELWCIDTTFFRTPHFQYRTATTPQWGYRETDQQYLWGIQNGLEDFKKNKWSQAIYLGNTMHEQTGEPIDNIRKEEIPTKYPFANWGNPFHWTYMTQTSRVFLSTKSPADLTDPEKQSSINNTGTLKENPYAFTVRYNPFKDKGYGNKLYLIPNYDNDIKKWDPTDDPDLLFENFPLWIMTWGLEDIVTRMGKCRNLYDDWTVVIQTKYMSGTEKYYVPVSYEFVHGQGPYDTPNNEISGNDFRHWYPKFGFQKQALENIAMSGPAVARGDNVKNIQATIKYDFLFKWGGNSPPQESIWDPTQQPVTPCPNNIDLSNEIIDPTASLLTEIYPGDFRRGLLTETAQKRITQSITNEQPLFTDGRKTSTDLQLFPQETQTEETPKTQEETLLLQLLQLQQFNNQLQHRFRKLKEICSDL